MKAFWSLLKKTYSEWSEDRASRLAAALAYYTIFSVAPLLVISIGVAGLVFGQEAARGAISRQISGTVGPQAAELIESMLANMGRSGGGLIATLIGAGTLIFGAIGVFNQLKDALNTIWDVQRKPGLGIMRTVVAELLSFTMVLGTGFLLLVSLALSAGLHALGTVLQDFLPGYEMLWALLNLLISFGVITLLFALIYKVLPDAEVAWSQVWIGAAFTALLFVIGKFLLGLYLGRAGVTSTYGAAGSLVAVLLWIYYSAQLLFFGAEFTQVYARRHGHEIVPSKYAIPLPPEAKATQGMPNKDRLVAAAAAHEAQAKPARRRKARPAGKRGGVDRYAVGLLGIIVGFAVAAFRRKTGA